MNMIKQIISLILPVTVLVIVPLSIEPDWKIAFGWSTIPGSALILSGLAIMAVTISLFIRLGRGTLAPWSPTQKLVIAGPYRYVRNPMILGVLTVLLGEAACTGSTRLLIWAALFFTINSIYFILYEEPDLEERFGKPYTDYKQQVSRWIPRLRPFTAKPD